MYDLQFPVGEYIPNRNPSEAQLEEWIQTIASFPKSVSDLVANALKTSLNWRYRPEG